MRPDSGVSASRRTPVLSQQCGSLFPQVSTTKSCSHPRTKDSGPPTPIITSCWVDSDLGLPCWQEALTSLLSSRSGRSVPTGVGSLLIYAEEKALGLFKLPHHKARDSPRSRKPSLEEETSPRTHRRTLSAKRGEWN